MYPNLTYDEQRTETAKKEALDNYAWANGVVQSGQKIIDRGEIVDKETYNILESLRKESIQRSESIGQKRLILTGQILFVSIFMLCFMPVSYTHLRAHETGRNLVCRLLLEKKKWKFRFRRSLQDSINR